MLERVGHRNCGWRRRREEAISTGEADLSLISSKRADEDSHEVSLFGLIISLHLVKNVKLLEFCLTFSCFMGLMRIILFLIFTVLISN